MQVQQHIHLQDDRRHSVAVSQTFLRTILVEYNIQYTISHILFILNFAMAFSRRESVWQAVST